MTYEGKLFALPRFTENGLLYYRKDLVPEPPATWDALVDVTKWKREPHHAHEIALASGPRARSAFRHEILPSGCGRPSRYGGTYPAMAAKNEAPGATMERIEPMSDSDMVTQAKDPVGLVGTIIAVVPLSRTVVVDVPLEKDVLRVGASITAGTIIKAGAAAAPFKADVLHPHPPPYDFHGHLTGDLAYSPEQVQHGWNEACAFFS